MPRRILKKLLNEHYSNVQIIVIECMGVLAKVFFCSSLLCQRATSPQTMIYVQDWCQKRSNTSKTYLGKYIIRSPNITDTFGMTYGDHNQRRLSLVHDSAVWSPNLISHFTNCVWRALMAIDSFVIVRSPSIPSLKSLVQVETSSLSSKQRMIESIQEHTPFACTQQQCNIFSHVSQ